MNVFAVLAKIQQAGGTIRVDAGDLVVAPRSVLDDADYRVLAGHKAEIVDLLGSSDSEPEVVEDLPWWYEPELTPEENVLLDEFMERDTLDDEGRGTELVLMSEECQKCHQRLGWVNMLGFERCLDCDRPRDLAGLARLLRERSGLPPADRARVLAAEIPGVTVASDLDGTPPSCGSFQVGSAIGVVREKPRTSVKLVGRHET